MKIKYILFALFCSTSLGCSNSGTGVGGALDKLQSSGPINGFWVQTSAACNGLIHSTMDEVTLTVTGEKASLSTSFDNGAGEICTVRTPLSAIYGETDVTFSFGESSCSTECQPLTCVSGIVQPPAPAKFEFQVKEPNLQLTTTQGIAFGCNNGQKLELNFDKQ